MPQKACEQWFCHVIAFAYFFEMPQNRIIPFSVSLQFENWSRVIFYAPFLCLKILKCPIFRIRSELFDFGAFKKAKAFTLQNYLLRRSCENRLAKIGLKSHNRTSSCSSSERSINVNWVYIKKIIRFWDLLYQQETDSFEPELYLGLAIQHDSYLAKLPWNSFFRSKSTKIMNFEKLKECFVRFSSAVQWRPFRGIIMHDSRILHECSWLVKTIKHDL